MSEQIGTSPKRSGDAAWRRTLDLIEAMAEIAEATQPITGRGIGYKLFVAGLIPSMEKSEMKRVYRLLKQGREEDIIPWHWIVDEAREFERAPSCTIRWLLRERQADNTGWISGSSSQSVARCGPRRARCAACSPRCLTTMALASG